MKLIGKSLIILIGLLCLLISQNTIYADTESDTTTKAGPKFSDVELMAIAKLSISKLAEMLKTGDTRHAYAALHQLKAGGGWKQNFDLLLDIAAETRGDMIVEGLIRPIKISASAEDKRIVDKFLDFLEGQLEKDRPSVYRRQAIRSIAKTVFITAAIEPAWRPYVPLWDPNKPDPNQLPVPYANERVVNILMSKLNEKKWRVRRDVIRWLGSIGENDFANADEIVAVLETRLIEEDKIQEKAEIKEKMKATVQRSLRELKRRIDRLRKGQ